MEWLGLVALLLVAGGAAGLSLGTRDRLRILAAVALVAGVALLGWFVVGWLRPA